MKEFGEALLRTSYFLYSKQIDKNKRGNNAYPLVKFFDIFLSTELQVKIVFIFV